jgi:DNA-directed RNA polymerase subunit beta
MGGRKQPRERVTFSKIPAKLKMPDLLGIQLESFASFLQENIPVEKRADVGLQSVFNAIFPIVDNRENFVLEFADYFVEPPKYSMTECLERGVSYSVPMKAKLRLSARDEESGDQGFAHTIEQDVYLGNLPYMTDRGTFIINGAERVIVSQLHRSPGVFFEQTEHPNGSPLYTGRIIPVRGSWVEFVTDINNIMYVFIDRRKKFPVTTFLRALGYSSDEELLELFNLVDAVELAGTKPDKYLRRHLAEEIVNEKTGEVICEYDTELTAELRKEIMKSGRKKIKLLKPIGTAGVSDIIYNTLRKDTSTNQNEALELIYRQLRSGEAPDVETAKLMIERLFFNPKKYDLGRVGRYRLIKKLDVNVPEENTVLTHDDFIKIIQYLQDLQSGKCSTDDIDHLGNRRIRTVGEQLATQFSVGFARMARTIKERMNLREAEQLTPQDLINARTISSVINSFFGTSQLSQFMDQTNPLSELTHKRRLSALGPGGLTRERAGFEVRDVHYTHYGRLCPIETPEGPNIGLISSLCLYGRINDFGFIETPYRKTEKGKVSDNIEYLSADDEDRHIIAQANAPLDEKGKFVLKRVKARSKGDFPVVLPNEVDYMDVSPSQITSAAAALIPFLEHDDANRALMGSNMQRQSVPLVRPEAPYVGTGLEKTVAHDSRAMVVSGYKGTVDSVTANEIVVRRELSSGERNNIFRDDSLIRYPLIKFARTNQDTCVNQRPIVKVGQQVAPGSVLADGCSTDNGELALGRNVLVAFLPWRGYNFEDAIVISERVVHHDVFTSIHIEEFELRVRDTKRGEEVLTREIPNVSEEATKDLDENGIIRLGAEINAGDIIVGKVTPKGETDPTPEEKLLKAIFGDKAGDVKDASLKAPPGMNGIVVATKLFSRKNKDANTRRDDKKRIDSIDRDCKKQIECVRLSLLEQLCSALDGKKSKDLRYLGDDKKVFKSGVVMNPDRINGIIWEDVNGELSMFDDTRVNTKVRNLLDDYEVCIKDIEEESKKEKYKVIVGDELPPGIVQLAKVYIAKRRRLSVGDKMAGRHGNKGVVARIVPVEDMPYLADGQTVDIVLNPLGVPSRMNLGQIYETALGWVAAKLGVNFATPVFDGASPTEVAEKLEEAGIDADAKTVLYDGVTGEAFRERVTVGVIYILKLSHLVNDKIHARSIGPYSLITQQPLGGKAQFGGQRFGEMEVWALEAYGAAYTLQEMLTVKSDDVSGRAKVYEAIVKGENLPEAGIPASFDVLARELQGLCLDVRIE